MVIFDCRKHWIIDVRYIRGNTDVMKGLIVEIGRESAMSYSKVRNVAIDSMGNNHTKPSPVIHIPKFHMMGANSGFAYLLIIEKLK